MAYYEVVPATAEHAAELALTIRPADAAEMWALTHLEPEEGLLLALKVSRETWAVSAEGKIICMFGHETVTAVGGVVLPWLMTSNEVPKHAVNFLRISKKWVEHLKARYSTIINLVDGRHTQSIVWLRWLGFTIGPGVPCGPDGVLFHRFSMKGT